VALVEQHRPDIVFLDIRMPGLTGVDAARRSPSCHPEGEDDDNDLPEIVFITAYDQYAVEAFEQGVVDYVLKPAERERLQLTAERLRRGWRRATATRTPTRRPAHPAAAAAAAPAARANPAGAAATWSGSRPASARRSR
jgi:DNA-binding LytR/AlgR family response regulator